MPRNLSKIALAQNRQKEIFNPQLFFSVAIEPKAQRSDVGAQRSDRAIAQHRLSFAATHKGRPLSSLLGKGQQSRFRQYSRKSAKNSVSERDENKLLATLKMTGYSFPIVSNNTEGKPMKLKELKAAIDSLIAEDEFRGDARVVIQQCSSGAFGSDVEEISMQRDPETRLIVARIIDWTN